MDSLNTLTPGEAAAAGGILGAMFGTVMVFCLLFFILYVIATWKIFEKAGEKGWKALIPIYNVYIMFKIVDMTNWFWALLGVSILSSIIFSIDMPGTHYGLEQSTMAANDISQHPLSLIIMLVTLVVEIWAGVLYAWRTSRVFGHRLGFCIGLILLPNIFWLILGFNKDKYNKKNLKA